MMILLTMILIITNVVIYSILKHVMENQFQSAGQSVAVSVSLIISEDLDGYRNFMKTRDTTSEYYLRMQGCFNKIKTASNIRFIYTLNKLDDTHIEVILDSEPIGSQYYSAPGSIERMNEFTRHVLQTRRPTALKPVHSSYGYLLGGYAPILDEHSELLGMVGIDIDYGEVLSIVQQLLIALTTIFILLLLFIYLLLSRVSHFILDPVLKDKLTGAYNKRFFESTLQKSIGISLKTNQDISILMLDLDYFKNINDTYGHIFGDVVLAKVATYIRECLRKDDFFVRYGGEEFAILIFDLKPTIAMSLAERIRKSVESHNIYNAEENLSIKMTISIGIANLQQRELSALELVNEADKALYKAKETRNTVVNF